MKLIESGSGEKTPLMESNLKVTKAVQAQSDKEIEKICKEYGVTKEILSMPAGAKRFREGSYSVASKLKEAQAELVFGQLLRAGVQTIFDGNYQAVDVVYEACVRQASSNKRQEFYAPLERAGFPKLTLPGDAAPETSFKGLDLELVNNKYTVMISFERELFEDDQTGQVQSKPANLGENFRIYEEAFVFNRMFAGSLSLDGEALPLSVTYGTPYATGVPGVSGGIHGNGNGVNSLTAARLSQTQLQNGWILAKKMFDQSGRPMHVDPKLLAVSPQDKFYADVLLNSVQSPSMSSTQSADIGKVGGIMGINPVKGLSAVVVSRFVPDYGALLIDAGKGFVMQRRAPTEMVQENPQSGPAFSQEVFRFRARARWAADFIDPKFMINLNSSFSPT